ncbi:MAG: cobalamin-independent methionine synthase II family protein [Acidobacteria bacterium]|nr:cobalamin-independent methionine synthase II family protein [Acidobacteriota bacterium]
MQTEAIGSIPRPPALIEAIAEFQCGRISDTALQTQFEAALQDTIEQFAETGSPIITDGEQSKPSFVTYPLSGLNSLAPDGVVIPFADGHTRQLPRLTKGPFKYSVHAGQFTRAARAYTSMPIKQAVISASALSLLYPATPLADYSREDFLADLIREAESDIRGALKEGAKVVQIDFTEARLSLKLDPSGGLLRSFIDLNNQVLDRFTAKEREQIGVHVCPGSDRDSPHSADVDYVGLIPELFQLQTGRFYLQMASEKDKQRAFHAVKNVLKANQLVFIGVIDPIDPVVETSEQARDRILEAAAVLPIDQLGTTDDCGFSPFADDISTARETAFRKIRARVQGTAQAVQQLA